jgi:hypothetical protein
MTDSIDFGEPGFPYLAFCPISIYDPANHNPEACPYCGPDNEMSDEDIDKIINGDWTPGQIASFERAHEPAPHRMTDSEWCTCGGKYNHVHTEQYSHAVNEITEDRYQCGKCKTWCMIVWDENGIELERRYEAD